VSLQPKPTLTGADDPTGLAKFTVVEGRGKGRRYKVDATATLGRSPGATIMLEDPEISRLHARVTKTESGKFELVDLESRNGTYVNGEKITRVTLCYGDRVRLGPNTVLEFYAFDATEALIIQRQRFESIGRLGVGIAHDLNNVLAALDAGTSYLTDLSPNSRLGESETRECLSDMSIAASRAAELIRAMLSFVRGRGHAHGPVDLSTLLHELSRMLRRTLDRRVTLALDVADGVVVHGNRSEIHQVLLNLCLNARDAMPDGGQLTLSASLASPPPDSSAFPNDNPVAVISVSDSGFGMDEATQARVFEPFFTTKRTGAGYGLGLATAREIVTVHGGQISVRSKLGEGTRFDLLLPAMLPEPTDSIPTENGMGQQTLHPPPQCSMLLVDDEAIVRRALARRLRQSGFTVHEVATGASAILRYAAGEIDIVVLDLDMPGMDGEETHRALLNIDPHVRVAYVTGYVDDERTQRLLRLGALAVFEKPCSLDSLMRLAGANANYVEDFTDDNCQTIT